MQYVVIYNPVNSKKEVGKIVDQYKSTFATIQCKIYTDEYEDPCYGNSDQIIFYKE